MAEPACSPDGTKIAYTDRVVSRLRIFVVNSDGTDATGFTSTPADAREPAWSPDGTKIVFYADNNSGCPFSFRCPLYLLDVETGTVSEVTVVARPPLNPGFSFDGSQIIFGQEGQGMWIVNTDGSGLTEVPLPDLGQFLYQEWSPVDNRIFFYGSEGGDFYWFTVLPDGSNLINRGPAYMSASAWSPAASWVAVWGTPRSLRRYSTVTWADSGGWYPEVSPSSSLSWCP
ncbi:PD40 domain-containing protein [Candidatus Uhrbacteria bacterium]|nr:PD40 domain-containing protein [Candidatus Uhrbacteria bacterium]